MTDRYAKFRELDVQRDGDVVTVRICHPGNGEEHTEFSRLFCEIRSDDVKVVVLTGEGDTFMPLADMRWYASVGEGDWLRLMREAKWLLRDMVELPQPIVVGLNGAAVGLGASIASFGDIIVAAEGATFGDSHLAMDLVAGDGGCLTLPLSIGVHRAKSFYLLGQTLSAQELFDAGLVTKVVPRDQLDNAVAAVVDRLLEMPREALQWSKMALNRLNQLSVLLGAEASLGHEGWSWHLAQAQRKHDAIRFAASCQSDR
ncbi:MAG TPA: enoyl-CoA hydratase/isomerase family protein [Mycobacterium sp.]|jgi:enoyl-CoA hydratase/carnithine racemase